MRLRTSFFNPTVYKKNLTRFAPVWLLYTLCLVLGMVLMYTNGGSIKNYWFASHIAEMIPVMGIINLAYALLIAQLLFGDLFNSRMCNALHAMPLKREGWFFTNVASGLTFSLVPTAVMATLSVPLLMGSLFVDAWKLGGYFFLAANLQYICFFGIAVFAVMCTGNRFAMCAGYGLINFGAQIVYWLIDTIYTPMLYGVITPTALTYNLTPVGHMIDQRFVIMDTRYDLMERFGNQLVDAVGSYSLTEEWWRLWACAGVGIAFALVALLLYRKRNLECAGDAVAFKSLVPVFQIPCAIVVAAGAQFFLEMFMGMADYSFLVLGVGLVVGWFIGKMLIERSTRVFRRRNWYGLLGLIAAIAVSLLATYMDVLNIEQSQPSPEEIKEIRIGTARSPEVSLTEAEDIEVILRLQQLAVEDRLEEPGVYVLDENGEPVLYSLYTEAKTQDTGETPSAAECFYATQVYLTYELEDGRLVKRRYNVWSDQEEGDILRQYLSRWEVVKNGWEQERLEMTLDTFKSVLYDSRREAFQEYQSVEDALSLIEAIKLDCEANLMAQDSWLHNGHFRYEDANYESGYYTRSYIYIYIQGQEYSWSVEIYPDSVNTLRWLQERDLLNAEVRSENLRY